jgi:GntR family transcriptional repressor for pyruvate dehydrogenase complex
MATTWVPSAGGARGRRRETVTDEVIRRLRGEILGGSYQLGERLPSEKGLARHFAVSAATIREVLRALETRGLVERRQGSGTYVTANAIAAMTSSIESFAQLNDVSILDVMDIRVVLGGYSAALAARRASEEDIAEIDRRNADVVAAVEEEGPLHPADAALAFQMAVSRASHNQLLHTLESVLARIMIHIQRSVLRDRGLDSMWRSWSSALEPDRVALIEGLRRHDNDASSMAIASYLGRQRRAFSEIEALASAKISEVSLIDFV